MSASLVGSEMCIRDSIESAPLPPSPEEASKKLKGSLSPSFIKDQFPQEYKEVKQGPSLEKQIQVLLEQLGAQGWELISISPVGGKLLFFFKRPVPIDPVLSPEGSEEAK